MKLISNAIERQKRLLFLLCTACCISFSSFGQNVEGVFLELKGQNIKLVGFKGISMYTIGKAKIDDQGKFSITFSKDNYGVALLKINDQNNFPVLLGDENIKLETNRVANSNEIEVVSGEQNKLFTRYNNEQALRDKAIEAWAFLDDLYYREAFLANAKQELSSAQQLIIKELERLRIQEQKFIQSLPKDSYLNWFLNTKKLLMSVENVIKYRPQFAENILKIFRQFNYADQRLYTSGLFETALVNHFWLISQNYSNQTLVTQNYKISIDAIYNQLSGQDFLINETTEVLIRYFEQQGFTEISKYLALKVLNDEECAITNDVNRKLERYRKMAIGAKVSDITFGEICNFPNQKEVRRLSEINSKYILVVFAAGWCPHCVNEIPKLADAYSRLKEKNVEVVLVSLDETKNAYDQFTKDLPFISMSDLQKWDGQACRDYYVNGTPTYYLINDDLELVLNPSNYGHVLNWVD